VNSRMLGKRRWGTNARKGAVFAVATIGVSANDALRGATFLGLSSEAKLCFNHSVLSLTASSAAFAATCNVATRFTLTRIADSFMNTTYCRPVCQRQT